MKKITYLILIWLCASSLESNGQTCPPGTYGGQCKPCPDACMEFKGTRECNKHTGHCSEGCINGRHGPFCDRICNSSCLNQTCILHNGQCTECEENYCLSEGVCRPCGVTNQSDCKTRCFSCNPICSGCLSGWYGENCSKQCSKCPGECHKDTGECVSCGNGTYGPACNEKCPAKCKKNVTDNATCNISYGRCSNGCLDGFYGKTCNFSCGKCRDGVCDQVIGDCKNGCTNGWGGSKCSIACLPNCMTCVDNSTCVKCSPGYNGSQCNGISSNSTQSGSGQTQKTFWVGVIVVVIIAVVLIAIIVYVKNKKKQGEQVTTDLHETKYRQGNRGDQLQVSSV